ncbi:hypothetical protein [Noviherbaspirillum saxi]|uniref:Uncharacterized protein n=1 Tax=Noviherbaspirillum saxi TaxID=2320863 RepID=A0A3A3GA55_9BURK|nr:hypothetical protein [Noviherbaspirillum saxi]RJF99035.1 hypothetical protein D3871_11325 [Noviherbaspirillum saxi]
MDAQQLKDIEARCDDVLNGFNRPSEVDARNAQKLLHFVGQLRQIQAAEAFANIGKTSSNGPLRSAFDEVMKDIFK